MKIEKYKEESKLQFGLLNQGGCYIEALSFSKISEIDNEGALIISTPGGRLAIVGKYPPFSSRSGRRALSACG